jgi:hypothetical protein
VWTRFKVAAFDMQGIFHRSAVRAFRVAFPAISHQPFSLVVPLWSDNASTRIAAFDQLQDGVVLILVTSLISFSFGNGMVSLSFF